MNLRNILEIIYFILISIFTALGIYEYFKKNPLKITVNLNPLENLAKIIDEWQNRPFHIIYFKGEPHFSISPKAMMCIVIYIAGVAGLLASTFLGSLYWVEMSIFKQDNLRGLLALSVWSSYGLGLFTLMEAMAKEKSPLGCFRWILLCGFLIYIYGLLY